MHGGCNEWAGESRHGCASIVVNLAVMRSVLQKLKIHLLLILLASSSYTSRLEEALMVVLQDNFDSVRPFF